MLEKPPAAVDDGINLVTEVTTDLVGTECRSLAAGVGARHVEGAADQPDELSGDFPRRSTHADPGPADLTSGVTLMSALISLLPPPPNCIDIAKTPYLTGGLKASGYQTINADYFLTK